MVAAVLVLLAPPAWADLMKAGPAAWARRFGGAQTVSSGTGPGGFTSRTRVYPRGPVVRFVGERPAMVEFPMGRDVRTWRQALASAGLPSRGVKATRRGGADLLTIPALGPRVRTEFRASSSERGLTVIVPETERTHPSPGERRAVLNALRARLKAQTGQSYLFRVSEIRLGDQWAFLSVEPRTPQDRPADWTKLVGAEVVREGIYDKGVFALLRQEGTGWRVKALAIGPTDVAYEPWPGEYRAPRGLFFPKQG